MTKKFLVVTLVLVFAAGFAAVAEDDKALTGSWENDLIFEMSNQNIQTVSYDSTLTVNYTTGGISYSSVSEFSGLGYESQEFSVDTTVGLLDLASTAHFNVAVQTPSLGYWKNQASLTLGGVSITDTFLLQETNSYGAGMDLMFAGETPGGVSVNVNNYFGMEPVTYDADGNPIGLITGEDASGNPVDSGYRIATEGRVDDGTIESGEYGGSSMQYVGTMLSLDGLSVGCCDFESETLFSELYGFEYTDFMFTMEAQDFPLSLETTIGFTPTEKTVDFSVGTDLGMDWACFTVWTTLDDVFEGGSFGLKGFALEEVELGDVYFSSYTALGDYNVYDLNDDFIDNDDYEEVIRIEKLAEFNLDFTADVYFNITEDGPAGQGGLFGLELFHADASYALSDQFSFGSGLMVYPDTGLGQVSLSLDYSW